MPLTQEEWINLQAEGMRAKYGDGPVICGRDRGCNCVGRKYCPVVVSDGDMCTCHMRWEAEKRSGIKFIEWKDRENGTTK